MTKILVSDQIAEAGIEILKRSFDVDTLYTLTPEQLCSIIPNYDALIVRSQTKVTTEVITAGVNLRVIGRAGVGIDNIDTETATRHGIVVVNSPQGNIISTAEHTIALILALARQIPKADSFLHAGNWNRKLKGTQIRNKTLGIIGLGRVGSEVACLANGLQMNVIAYDPIVSAARAEKIGAKLTDLPSLLSCSDFVTIHVPLSNATVGMIGAEELKLLKPTAMIINCARGGIIDESALFEALNKGTLAGAAIDVFTREPAVDNILIKSDKIIVTPHLAASTNEAEISAGKDIAEEVLSVLNGYPPKSPVNAPSISPEALPIINPYLRLGAILGKIAIQLSSGNLNSLTIRYEGEIADRETEALKASILSGLLEFVTDEYVNMINAQVIAATKGLVINEFKNSSCENYANMLTVEVQTGPGSTLISGTCLRGKSYITRINEFWLEIEPSSRYLLITDHQDRPGMVGSVGTIVGNADVNISQMHVSHGVQRGTNAMMVLCLDDPLLQGPLQKIVAIPGMNKASVVQMYSDNNKDSNHS
jgi:D-3-phosphoglycerate dehydrogenase / 2-oxoglutarate reductase